MARLLRFQESPIFFFRSDNRSPYSSSSCFFLLLLLLPLFRSPSGFFVSLSRYTDLSVSSFSSSGAVSAFSFHARETEDDTTDRFFSSPFPHEQSSQADKETIFLSEDLPRNLQPPVSSSSASPSPSALLPSDGGHSRDTPSWGVHTPRDSTTALLDFVQQHLSLEGNFLDPDEFSDSAFFSEPADDILVPQDRSTPTSSSVLMPPSPGLYTFSGRRLGRHGGVHTPDFEEEEKDEPLDLPQQLDEGSNNSIQSLRTKDLDDSLYHHEEPIPRSVAHGFAAQSVLSALSSDRESSRPKPQAGDFAITPRTGNHSARPSNRKAPPTPPSPPSPSLASSSSSPSLQRSAFSTPFSFNPRTLSSTPQQFQTHRLGNDQKISSSPASPSDEHFAASSSSPTLSVSPPLRRLLSATQDGTREEELPLSPSSTSSRRWSPNPFGFFSSSRGRYFTSTSSPSPLLPPDGTGHFVVLDTELRGLLLTCLYDLLLFLLALLCWTRLRVYRGDHICSPSSSSSSSSLSLQDGASLQHSRQSRSPPHPGQSSPPSSSSSSECLRRGQEKGKTSEGPSGVPRGEAGGGEQREEEKEEPENREDTRPPREGLLSLGDKAVVIGRKSTEDDDEEAFVHGTGGGGEGEKEEEEGERKKKEARRGGQQEEEGGEEEKKRRWCVCTEEKCVSCVCCPCRFIRGTCRLFACTWETLYSVGVYMNTPYSLVHLKSCTDREKRKKSRRERGLTEEEEEALERAEQEHQAEDGGDSSRADASAAAAGAGGGSRPPSPKQSNLVFPPPSSSSSSSSSHSLLRPAVSPESARRLSLQEGTASSSSPSPPSANTAFLHETSKADRPEKRQEEAESDKEVAARGGEVKERKRGRSLQHEGEEEEEAEEDRGQGREGGGGEQGREQEMESHPDHHHRHRQEDEEEEEAQRRSVDVDDSLYDLSCLRGDLAAYLHFLNTAGACCKALGLAGCFLLLPVYIFAERPHREVYTLLDICSAVNKTSRVTVWTMYGASWIFSCMIYFAVYRYWVFLKSIRIPCRPPGSLPLAPRLPASSSSSFHGSSATAATGATGPSETTKKKNRPDHALAASSSYSPSPPPYPASHRNLSAAVSSSSASASSPSLVGDLEMGGSVHGFLALPHLYTIMLTCVDRRIVDQRKFAECFVDLHEQYCTVCTPARMHQIALLREDQRRNEQEGRRRGKRKPTSIDDSALMLYEQEARRAALRGDDKKEGDGRKRRVDANKGGPVRLPKEDSQEASREKKKTKKGRASFFSRRDEEEEEEEGDAVNGRPTTVLGGKRAANRSGGDRENFYNSDSPKNKKRFSWRRASVGGDGRYPERRKKTKREEGSASGEGHEKPHRHVASSSSSSSSPPLLPSWRERRQRGSERPSGPSLSTMRRVQRSSSDPNRGLYSTRERKSKNSTDDSATLSTNVDDEEEEEEAEEDGGRTDARTAKTSQSCLTARRDRRPLPVEDLPRKKSLPPKRADEGDAPSPRCHAEKKNWRRRRRRRVVPKISTDGEEDDETSASFVAGGGRGESRRPSVLTGRTRFSPSSSPHWRSAFADEREDAEGEGCSCVLSVRLVMDVDDRTCAEEPSHLLHHRGYHRTTASIGLPPQSTAAATTSGAAGRASSSSSSSSSSSGGLSSSATSSSSCSSTLDRHISSYPGERERGGGGFLIPLTPLASSPFSRVSLLIPNHHADNADQPISSSSRPRCLVESSSALAGRPSRLADLSSSSSRLLFSADSPEGEKRRKKNNNTAGGTEAEEEGEFATEEGPERGEDESEKKTKREKEKRDERSRGRRSRRKTTQRSGEVARRAEHEDGEAEEESLEERERREEEEEEEGRKRGICRGGRCSRSTCLPGQIKKRFRKSTEDEEKESREGESLAVIVRPPAKPLAPYRNCGVAFVTFDNQLCVKEALRNTYRYRAASRARTRNNRSAISFARVRCLPAPPPSDLRWENLHVSRFNQLARIIGLNALLLFLSVTVISPVALLNELTPIVESIDKQLVEHRITRLTITAWLPPLILLFINSFVQPLLVSYVAAGSAFWRKSRETAYILHGNIVFQILNTIIIPLLSLSSIESVLEILYSNEIRDWSVILGFTLMHSSGSFALRYLLNLSFLAIANEMLQLFTLLGVKINRFFFCASGKKCLYPPFDIGFAYAQALSVFTLVLLFSVVLPVILPFGILYFCFRFYVDKYNFIYHVYSNIDFNSDGRLAVTAIKYMLFAIAFLQFAMAGFFITQDDTWMPLAGGILLLLSLISWIVLLCYSIAPPGSIEEASSARLARSTEGVQILLPRQRRELRDAYTQPCGFSSTCDCPYKIQTY